MRGIVSWQSWERNPAVRDPGLDGAYYLAWARDIASGDLAGASGTIRGEPFLLNPLYAYVLAPIVKAFGATPAPVLVLQALLAGGTAALAAAAALRWSGRAAAWTAGACVALSASLVHLDAHVAVSGLAAFLVAATCFSCAPAPAGERWRRPLASGAWLGLSALARPVALLALPFVTALHARRAERPWRAALLVLAGFAAFAAASFARNAAVSGEPVVFTAANGLNLHLGNNPEARRLRTMHTDEFRFAPREMHEDAKLRVAAETGEEPSRAEVSAWFADRALAEARGRPLDSAAWYATKARWFFSPQEPASSADYDHDRRIVPALALAFVPTWLVAALAVAGAVLCRARRDLLLGPGALALAHLAACTLAFPLSHYRSPAVPAMAVLAGAGVAAALDALRSGQRRGVVVAFASAGAAAAAGALPPQPAYRRDQLLVNEAVASLYRGDLDAAERGARAALEIEPGSLGAVTVLMDVGKGRGRPAEARPYAQRLADAHPWNPLPRFELLRLDLAQGRAREEVLDEAARLATAFPWSGSVRARAGELRCESGDLVRAAEDLREAVRLGGDPAPWALERCGLR